MGMSGFGILPEREKVLVRGFGFCDVPGHSIGTGELQASQRVNECGSRTCKPNSVRLAAGRSFLWAAHYCAAQATYPEVVTRRAGTSPPILAGAPNRQHSGQNGRGSSLFGLAPCGVCPARCITAAAVRSYRTFSPLPRPFWKDQRKSLHSFQNRRGGMFSVALSVRQA